MKDLKINQSLICDVFANSGEARRVCPKRIYHQYIKGIESVTTEAMKLGNYFEYKCLGKPSRGRPVPILATKKDGGKYADHIRIEQQAERFKSHLENAETFYIEIEDTDVYVEVEYYIKELDVTVTLKGTFDFVGKIYYINQDGEVERICNIIGDLKLTKDLESEWGYYNWSNPGTIDQRQGIMYSLIARLTNYFKNDLDTHFMYFVYDYTSMLKYEFFRVRYNGTKESELKEYFRKLVIELEEMQEKGYPYNPIFSECGKCAIKDNCPARRRIRDIKDI